jgi:hypothetical protein
MDVNYFGLLRLAQEFGPVMRARVGRRRHQRHRLGQPAVDLRADQLSRRTAPSRPARRRRFAGAVPARRDAAGGLRVINVFPGPDRRRMEPAAAAAQAHAPAALANAVVAALRDGVEDVYPGDVAQEWRTRYARTPRCSSANSRRAEDEGT